MVSRPTPRLDGWAVALAVLGLVLALPVLAYPLGRDQGTYANIAVSIQNGGLPYIDMWDIKPPAIYYLYALAFSLFGQSAPAVHALDFIFVPLTLVPLYFLTRRAAGITAARWAMLLLPVFYFTETFASVSQSDSLVIAPMAWAVWLVVRAGDAPRGSPSAVRWALGAGMLCALVLWFKHYYVAFALALALEHVLHRRGLPWREGLAFGLGGVLVGLPIFLYAIQTGIWAEMLLVAQGTAAYSAQSFTSFTALVEQFSHYLAFRWSHWGVLLTLAALALIIVPRRDGGRGRMVGLWLAAGLAFVLVQGKGFDTHWLPLLPPLVMGAAAALARLTPPQAAWGRVAAVGAVMGLGAILAVNTSLPAFPYLTGQETQRAYFRQFQAGDINAAESLRMAQWLRERTQPGDTLYIWGFRPEVTFMAGLRPATRFQMHFPLIGQGYPDQWKQENVDTLWQVLPPVVVVMRADYMPWVTGSDDDSNTILAQDYTALRDWLIFNYDRGEEIGNFLVWIRKGE